MGRDKDDVTSSTQHIYFVFLLYFKISIHKSPSDRKERIKWVNFVKLNCANFFPIGDFSICSEHFLPECFHCVVPVPGTSMARRLKKGSCPTISMKTPEESACSSSRKRRKVFFVDYCIFVFIMSTSV